MDKFEYKVKVEEIKNLISEGDFEGAVDVADTVDWSIVKNIRTLCMISDLYKKNRLFEESRTVLLYAYNKQKARPIVKSLCELSIELGDLIAAIEYCKEFIQIAPKDPSRYILQYKIYKAQDVNLEEQIGVLEELKKHEYMEKWAYELATLYHRVGLEDKCVEECNELILWFVDGRYVIKAYELMAQHRPLSEQETYKYELLRQAGGELNIQYSLREEEQKEPVKKEFAVGQDVSPYNTQSLQAVVAEGLQDYLDRKTAAVPVEEINSYEEAVQKDEEILSASEPEEDPELMVTQMYNPVMPEEPVGQELLEDTGEVSKFTDEDILGEAQKESSADMLKNREVVLRQDTDEIKMISDVDENIFSSYGENEELMATKTNKPEFSNTGIINNFHKGSNMDNMLSQESDGQISLVVPSEPAVEKQITGQISIDDIMQEWERKKKEAEERRVKSVRDKIRKEASSLLADFDESSKSSLLEQIENAMITAALKEEQDRIAQGRPKQIKVSDINRVEKTLTGIDLPSDMDTTQLVLNVLAEDDAEIVDDGVEEIAEIEEVSETEETTKVEETAEPVEVPEAEEVFEDTDEEDAEDSVEELAESETADEEIPETSKEAVEEEPEEVNNEEIKKEIIEEKAPITDIDDDTNKEPEEETVSDSLNKEEEAASEKESKRGRVRELTDAEKEQFAAFIHHKSTQKQLAHILDNVTLSAYTGNILITSEEDNEITTFSKILVREIQLSDSNFTGKVAKVSGDNLNRKDIAQTLKCVTNGALIISEAEGLMKKTVESLLKELNNSEMGVVVVMQGHADVIDKIVTKNPGMAEAFNLRIDLKAFDNKTLVEYAKTYAYDNEYSIDEFGILALHTRIADMQTSDHEVSLSEIEEIVDEAIYYADKKTPAHFFDVLFGTRYDDEDMIVLREKDFTHY